jgi:hypothetical protein
MAKLTPERLKALQRERGRNRRDLMEDQHLAAAMRRASRLLAEFEHDFCFRFVLRNILTRHDDHVPPNLRALYVAERIDYVWMNQGMKVTPGLPERAIQAVSQLAISIQQDHARLADLAGRPCR